MIAVETGDTNLQVALGGGNKDSILTDYDFFIYLLDSDRQTYISVS